MMGSRNFGLSEMRGAHSHVRMAGREKFPNPYLDMASEYIPRDLNTLFELCEFIYMSFGLVRAAQQRVNRYFLTDLVVTGGGDQERQDLKTMLDDLRVIENLGQIGDDRAVYGNSFSSLYMPFDRYLVCPKCGTHHKAAKIKYQFSLADTSFTGTCPRCKSHVRYRVEDRKSWDKSRIKIVRWNPKNIRLKVHPISGRTAYFMKMHHKLGDQLASGDPFFINDTPLAILRWANQARAGSNVYFEFDPNELFHMREATLAGLPIVGWGIPPLLPNLRLAYYIQLLRRYDEAIALDFIIPFRVMFPKASLPPGGAMDPILVNNLAQYRGHLQQMIANKRIDPTNIQISPVEVGYQMIGGEANALAPKESLSLAQNELLDSMGFPAELYRATLSIQAFPVALRLFEKTWAGLYKDYNQYLRWYTQGVARYYSMSDMEVKLRSVTLADDLENKHLLMDAAAGMDISKGTAYEQVGIDYMSEQEKVIEEQKEIMRLQEEAMAEEQAEEEISGDAGMPGGMAGATPGDVHEQARQIAHEMVVEVPETLRRGELLKIRNSNPTLHALVLMYMDELRRDYARQGQAMMIQQEKMGSADQLASPFMLKALISEQLMDVSRKNLRRIAMDTITSKAAQDAFHFVFAHQRGFNPASYRPPYRNRK